jgi:hypothetical protein
MDSDASYGDVGEARSSSLGTSSMKRTAGRKTRAVRRGPRKMRRGSGVVKIRLKEPASLPSRRKTTKDLVEVFTT